MDYDFTCENVTVVDGVSFEYQFGVKITWYLIQLKLCILHINR